VVFYVPGPAKAKIQWCNIALNRKGETMIERFIDGQRVRIIDHCSRPELNGMTGVVVRRLRLTDGAAWIRMDTDLPTHCRSFLDGDERANDTRVYADEVETA